MGGKQSHREYPIRRHKTGAHGAWLVPSTEQGSVILFNIWIVNLQQEGIDS